MMKPTLKNPLSFSPSFGAVIFTDIRSTLAAPAVIAVNGMARASTVSPKSSFRQSGCTLRIPPEMARSDMVRGSLPAGRT
jgi:hypothetical protein